EFNQGQLLIGSTIEGTSEAVLGALPTLGILKRAVGTSTSRSLFKKGFSDGAIEFTKDLGIELGTENLTEIFQDANDRYVLGDKSVVVGGNMDKTSASVLASMPVFIFGGRVSSEIVKRFSPKSDIEQIRSNIQQIQQLQQDLQNASSESVRNQIQQKIFEIEEANDNVFQKASETISNMDDARYNRVNEITKQQANLQVQAESILNDTGLSNDRKKSLINELNNQFT